MAVLSALSAEAPGYGAALGRQDLFDCFENTDTEESISH
jgi:hypothetical protein